jgi:tyrosyl-tRNA synthetase
MMWRYYELLTDVKVPEIEKMKADVASGQAHPMALKKDLASKIVADFHSPDAAAKAAEDWARQFQKDETPENVEEVVVELADVEASSPRVSMVDVAAQETSIPECRIKLDKLIARAGLADSVTDAVRKLKQKAVKVNGELKSDPIIFWDPRQEMTLRVGKKIKKVRFDITGAGSGTSLSS